MSHELFGSSIPVRGGRSNAAHQLKEPLIVLDGRPTSSSDYLAESLSIFRPTWPMKSFKISYFKASPELLPLNPLCRVQQNKSCSLKFFKNYILCGSALHQSQRDLIDSLDKKRRPDTHKKKQIGHHFELLSTLYKFLVYQVQSLFEFSIDFQLKSPKRLKLKGEIDKKRQVGHHFEHCINFQYIPSTDTI